MEIFTKTKRFCHFVADVFFPRNCVVCGRRVTNIQLCKNICQDCYGNICWVSSDHDDVIFAKYKAEFLNFFCKRGVFSKGMTCFKYAGVGRELIVSLKYNGCDFLSRDIAKLISLAKPSVLNYIKNAILVPVPIHYTKHVMRDYNQSELIANALAKYSTGVCVKKLLSSKKHESQTSLSTKERLNNIKNIFKCKRFCEDSNKRIIVVDDVVTTGATVLACCSQLLGHGFTDVNILTLAHGD